MRRHGCSFTRLASIKYSLYLPNSKMRSVHNGLINNYCKQLQILDYLEVQGLEVVSSTYESLKELRVFQLDHCCQGAAKEEGLMAIFKE